MSDSAMTRATLTIPELARLLGTNRPATYALAQAGSLPVPTFRVGRKILVSRHSVEALVGKDAVAALLDDNPQGDTGSEDA